MRCRRGAKAADEGRRPLSTAGSSLVSLARRRPRAMAGEAAARAYMAGASLRLRGRHENAIVFLSRVLHATMRGWRAMTGLVT